ncbi:acyl-CoA dehydrogenase [Alkalilimnicola ehrlichii]|uniref:Acyl-CoA dehydrogenase n=1 Tax=Alkalilimnicola ehrlichii TaxID=351052 RepID=A0A3E0WVB7_9GAMM|nr:acyl-CoA dehydrogenase family protein [Alkalilimnicola ehrlichii]RFA29212.1 acyl-CoA dehydrogenase [Alkalilimnicola ehrlichii]RFA36123.1 acyl-CoA dehydrogenase [Alkalilimnicola ehrlichii]
MSIQEARAATEQYLPGLIAELKHQGLMQLEHAEPAQLCQLFRRSNAAGLLIPQQYGGLGASPRDTINVLRAVGSLCPSLAVMMTMHHHTIATIVQLGGIIPAAEDLLRSIANNQLLLASAFAEGKPGSPIFNSSLKASAVDGGFVLRGTKKPCTMSHDMDVIVAGVACTDTGGVDHQGFAVIFAEGANITREPFWKTPILRATDSNALIFNDVFVPDEMVLLAEGANAEEIEASAQEASISGLCWFQLMVGASYLGAASALVELLVCKRGVQDTHLAQLAIELEGAHQALLGTAGTLEQRQEADAGLYSQALCSRFSVQAAIERASNLAVELLGGMSFIESEQVSYLLAASRAIGFHPISRTAAAPTLADFLRNTGSTVDAPEPAHV